MFTSISRILTAALLSSSLTLQGGPLNLYDLDDPPFSTFIARKPGDLVTIIVEEKAVSADNGARKNERKDNSDFQFTQLFFPPIDIQDGFTRTVGGGSPAQVAFQTNSTYEGKAEHESDHKFYTTIEARLVEEMNEGHFVIRAHKDVWLNGKQKTLFLSGVIRQRDIAPDNTILSTFIADAVIEIDGEVGNEDVRPGFLNRLFNLIF